MPPQKPEKLRIKKSPSAQRPDSIVIEDDSEGSREVIPNIKKPEESGESARRDFPAGDPRNSTWRDSQGYISPYRRRQMIIRKGSPKK